ncbi:MAG: hypothetical protein FWE45_03345 [Firmicutes bacterium]|nr:hypothetical protein [Bacillota bacterium]
MQLQKITTREKLPKDWTKEEEREFQAFMLADAQRQEINEFWKEHIESLDYDIEQTNKNLSFISRTIKELLGRDFQPITKEYSSHDMNELQNMVYLIEQTDNILFPNGEKYIAQIIKDEYDRSKGTQGVLDVINKYVKWVDITKRF